MLIRLFAFVLCCASALAHPQEYRLGAGDQVRITVFRNPDLNTDARVSEAGTITFPLVGSVPIAGLTPAEAERAIAVALVNGRFVLDPQVGVLVLVVRGSQITVLGQVARPGRYPIEVGGTRLVDALALAGGVAATGSDRITILGRRDGGYFLQEIDVAHGFRQGFDGDNIVLAAGDVIYAHRAAQFFIYGEVQRPGAYRLEPKMTVLQGLAQGGGLTTRGTERGVRMHRRDPEGRIERRAPSLDEPIQPGDVIHVPRRLF